MPPDRAVHRLLDRLTQAWTATDLCAKDPSVSGSGTVGGASPFWESWTFDSAGDRTSQTAHALPVTPLSGSNPLTPTTGSNVTTYASGSAGHAHALTGTTTTGPNAGSTTQSVDADGQVTARSTVGGSQSIGWDELGQVASVTTPAGKTSYVNDASGDPLLEVDASGASTLFLGAEDVTVAGSAVSKVVRHYAIGGAEVAYRINGAGPTYVESDLQGSNRVAYTPSGAGASPAAKVSRSFADPYGNSLSARGGSDLVSPVLGTGRSFTVTAFTL